MKKLALAWVMSVASCLVAVNVQAAPAIAAPASNSGSDVCQIGDFCKEIFVWGVHDSNTVTIPVDTSGKHQYFCQFSGDNLVGVNMGHFSFTPGVGFRLPSYPALTSNLEIDTVANPVGGALQFNLQLVHGAGADIHLHCYQAYQAK